MQYHRVPVQYPPPPQPESRSGAAAASAAGVLPAWVNVEVYQSGRSGRLTTRPVVPANLRSTLAAIAAAGQRMANGDILTMGGEHLWRSTGLSRRAFYYHVERLEAAGFLQRVKRRGDGVDARANAYRIPGDQEPEGLLPAVPAAPVAGCTCSAPNSANFAPLVQKIVQDLHHKCNPSGISGSSGVLIKNQKHQSGPEPGALRAGGNAADAGEAPGRAAGGDRGTRPGVDPPARPAEPPAGEVDRAARRVDPPPGRAAYAGVAARPPATPVPTRPRLHNVQPADLYSMRRLLTLFDDAVAKGMFRDTEEHLELFVACALYSREHATRPARMFARLIRQRTWPLSESIQDQAHAWIQAELGYADRGVDEDSGPPAPVRPPRELSSDARIVGRVLRFIHEHPRLRVTHPLTFAQLHLGSLVQGWDLDRWLAAERELRGRHQHRDPDPDDFMEDET